MSIRKVKMTADVYWMCVSHAFSIEKQEIMGLLIGENEGVYCSITSVIVLRRSDKRQDRVEISPEQLSNASNKAEMLSHTLNKPLRIVGWYHSHPHITAWPSRIDVHTQASYQLMDPGFIGLIFSVFNQDKINKVNRIQVCCFQSESMIGDRYERVDTDLQIVPKAGLCKSCIDCYCELPKIFQEEEEELYEKTKHGNLDFTSKIFNEAVYAKNTVQIIECIHIPLIAMMEQRLVLNENRLKHIQTESEQIQKLINKERQALECNNKIFSETTI